MIKCKVMFQIHGSNSAASSLDKWLYLNFSLPHFPSMGTILKLNKEIDVDLIDRPRYEGGGCSLYYDIKTKLLTIYIEDMDSHQDKDRTFDQVISDYKKLGWKIAR